MKKDFYAILSVPRHAKPPQIKHRFLELARERHPDRFQGAEKEQAELDFQSITEAFNVLMDPVRRRQHDLELDSSTSLAAPDSSNMVRAYLNRGIRAFKRTNFAEAADNFTRATQADPENYQAWHHLALACSKEKRWLPQAQQAIEKACTLRPNQVSYLKLAGKIFAMSGLTARARHYYNQALSSGAVDPAINKALKALGDTSGRAAAGRATDGRTAPDELAERSGAPESGATTTAAKQGKSGLFKKDW